MRLGNGLVRFLRRCGPAEWICIFFIALACLNWGSQFLPASAAAKQELVALAGNNEEAQIALDCELNNGGYVSRRDVRRLRTEVERLVLSELPPMDPAMLAEMRAKYPVQYAISVEKERLRYSSIWSLSGEDLLKLVLLWGADHPAPFLGTLLALAAFLVLFLLRRKK